MRLQVEQEPKQPAAHWASRLLYILRATQNAQSIDWLQHPIREGAAVAAGRDEQPK